MATEWVELLTAEEQSNEGPGAVGWIAQDNASNLVRSTAWAADGVSSLRWSATATGQTAVRTRFITPPDVGATYRASIWCRFTSTSVTQVALILVFRNTTGAWTRQANFYLIGPTPGTPVELVTQGVPFPAVLDTFVVIYAYGATAGDQIWIDKASLTYQRTIPDPVALMVGSTSIPTSFVSRTVETANVKLRLMYLPAGTTTEQIAQARAIESDLVGQTGAKIAVSRSTDTSIDGWYRLERATVAPLDEGRTWQIDLELTNLGSLAFTSALIGGTLTNDFGITTAAEPIHAPPSHTSYDPGGPPPGYIDRTMSTGQGLRVYRSVALPSYPTWRAVPSTYPTGAAHISRTAAAAPATGVIGGLVYDGIPGLIRPGNYLARITVASAGNPLVEFWDGTAWRSRLITLWVGATAIPGWHKTAIKQNTPESVVVSYLRTEDDGTRVSLDITVRRGMRGIIGYLTRAAAADLAVSMDVAATATSERMLENVADAQGHKLVLSTARTYTATPATGQIKRLATTGLDFFAGLQLSGAVAGDTALALSMQYFGWVTETTQTVPV